jgi:hypothetical protein
LTDPLTGKELVEKSYDYVDKLTRECSKVLLEEFNASHRKFDQKNFGAEVGHAVAAWFTKRDKNLRLAVDSVNVHPQQLNTAHVRFKGSTKDAEFDIAATVGTFSIPGADGKSISFVKTLVFSVEKNNFRKRKV